MLDLRDAAVIDFENLPIRDRPHRRPPAPVGVAVAVPGSRPRYLAFGHPTGNTCGWEDARRAVGEAYDSGRPLLFHNAKHDVDEAETHLGLARLGWERYHDTQPQLFLRDPRAPSFRLKESAERILGEPPDERNAVEAWLLDHQPVPGVKLSRSLNSEAYVGAYIAWAPPALVGPYAVGDVTRTRALARHVLPELRRRGMLDAYDRERRMLPVALEMERQGIRVDVRALERDVGRGDAVLVALDTWLRKLLRAPGLNPDSGEELVRAAVRPGEARAGGHGYTEKTRKLRSDHEALARGVKDPQLLAVLTYRAKLCTSLRTFMRPWLAEALRSGGFIYTTWNSIRQDRGDGLVGARTGRFSSTPNFQNLPKQFEPLFRHEERDPRKARRLPRAPLDLPPLPRCRSYLVPWDASHVLLDRDYSQQELRILAHYSGGAMRQAYLDDPWLDHHEHARVLINDLLHASYERKPIKNTGLGIIYGMGLGKLAARSGTTVEIAKQVRDAYLAIFPGLKEMYREVKRRAAAKEPIRTWGGREYFCEEPRLVDGRIRVFDYKLLNVLIQGSAADCMKEALIRYHAAKDPDVRIYLTAHDEALVSAPRRGLKRHMEVLRETMESVEFDVAMLSEGATGASWADLRDYDKAGHPVAQET